MATNNDVKDLFEKYVRIEHEIKLLQDDKKELLSNFKERIDPRVFQSALRAAKMKSKLKQSARDEFDNVMLEIEKQLTVESIE
jgi:uncharacterized protein (UPF0335 family)